MPDDAYQGDDPLAVRYSKKPLIGALVQLIPYVGGAGHSLAMERAERIKAERARAFFDELSAGEINLSEELIQSDDFLHSFFVTLEAGLRARHHEKTVMFAKLLKSAFTDNRPRNIDELEEFTSILDDLSHEEWGALLILDRYSDVPRDPAQNDLQWSRSFWDRFVAELEGELDIPHLELTPFLNRIARTGLYDQFVGGYMDYTGGLGMLTQRFHRLKTFVRAQGL